MPRRALLWTTARRRRSSSAAARFCRWACASVEGRFEANDIVDIKDATGHLFARGKVAFAIDEAALAIGRTRAELQANRLLASFDRQAARPSRRVGRLRIGGTMERETVRDQVRRIAEEARGGERALAQTSADERNGALASMAAALRSRGRHRRGERLRQWTRARKAGTKEGLLDRLMLDEGPRRSHGGRARGPRRSSRPVGGGAAKAHVGKRHRASARRRAAGVVAVVYEARRT